MSKQNTPFTIIVGYGNPLRRDDGAGPELIRRLQAHLGAQTVLQIQQLVHHDQLGLLVVHQLSPELCETLKLYDHAVFVDASVELDEFTVEQVVLPCEAEMVYHSHSLTPRQLAMLCMLSQNDGRLKCIYILHLPALDMSVGEGFTPAMVTHMDEALLWIKAYIDADSNHVVH